MVSPELLRRYRFFGQLGADYLKKLAMVGKERTFDEGHVFFGGDYDIDSFFVVVEGRVGITHAVPARGIEHTVADQLVRELATEDVVVSSVERGEVFGWSSLLPPYRSTAGAVALAGTTLVEFDSTSLREEMEADPAFGFRLTQALAKVVHQRLRDRQIECIVGVLERIED